MTIYELLKTLKGEEGIALFNTKKTDKEVYDLLVAKGLTDSFEEFTAFFKPASKLTETELSDADLEKVAGGYTWNPTNYNYYEAYHAYQTEYLATWQPGGGIGMFADQPLSFQDWLSTCIQS